MITYSGGPSMVLAIYRLKLVTEIQEVKLV